MSLDRYYVGSAALVSGEPAAKFAKWLRPALDRARRAGTLTAEEAEDWYAQLYALERAAEDWRASVVGSVGRGAAEALASSPHDHDDEQLDSAGAAAMLGVTPRRATQLADTLGARKVAGRWVFDRDELLAYIDQRGTAA